jgi:hypothetical protein
MYPRKSTLKAGEKAVEDAILQEQLPMSYVAPGGSVLASVELPGKSKNEMGDLFLLSVNQELTAEQCGQFPVGSPIDADESSTTEASGSQQPVLASGLKTTFRGVEYSELDKQVEEGGIRYYHRFVPTASQDKGACYEFGMRAKAESSQAADAQNAEHKDVFTRLEKILASVKIESKKQTETVEAATTDTPIANDSTVKETKDSAAETAKAIVKNDAPR